jgi:hypothetical protein
MGSFSGVAFSYPLFGFIANHFGWRAIFYTAGEFGNRRDQIDFCKSALKEILFVFGAGGFALLWCAVWLTFVANDPAVDKYITEEERKYLKKKIQHISTEKVRCLLYLFSE